MASLLSSVSSAVAACSRRVLRATRRLLRRGRSLEKQHVAAPQGGGGGTGVGEDGEGLWRRAILMGQRCEPLDFTGAIHYDSLGRRIAQPRGKAKAATMLCRSSDAVDEAVTDSKKTRYVALVQN